MYSLNFTCFSFQMKLSFMAHIFFFFFWIALGLGSTLLPAGFSLVAESGSYSLVVGHRLLIAEACLVAEYKLWEVRSQELRHMVLHALHLVGSSWSRDTTHVPCIGRQILNHWTTKEVLARFSSSIGQYSLDIQNSTVVKARAHSPLDLDSHPSVA